MLKQKLHTGWEFWQRGQEEKQIVNLPHDAMIHRKRIKRLKDGSYTGFYPSGDYFYRKELFGEECWQGKYLMLEFEGVYMYSTVYLNGDPIGGHAYGYSNYYVDLTDRIKIGTVNEILVEVHCSQVPNARWYPGNGIYRPVWLYTGSKRHIIPDTIQIETISIDPPEIEIRVGMSGKAIPDEALEISIIDGDHVLASAVGENARFVLPEAKLWDADHPNLYQARMTLKSPDGDILDQTDKTFGIRSLEADSQNGLRINGEKVLLRGGCIHHDNGILGACDFEAASERKIRILKEAGFNAIRSAHNPISKSMLRACDKIGMYVMDEAFDNWIEPTGQYGYTLEFEKDWEEDLSGMVIKDRNHPSVILYSIGNEISDTATPEGAFLAGKMRDLCHSLDATRPVLVCPNLFMNTLSQMGFHLSLGDGKQPSKEDITDPEKEAPDSRLGGSVAINFLVMTGPVLMNLLLTPKRSEKGVRDVYNKVDIAGYNYGTKVYEGHHKFSPERVMVGSETYPGDIAKTWKFIQEHPYVIGDFMWTAWDYLGEVGLGFIEYGKRTGAYIKPYPAVSAYSGTIDLTGSRDTYSHLAAIVWGLEETPYISVEPLNHTGERKRYSHYRKTDGVANWSWPGYEGRKTIVRIYSSGQKVKLFQNGREIGTKRVKEYAAAFPVVYQPGYLEAVSYDEEGREHGRCMLKTANDEKCITLSCDRKELKADGEDLAFVDISLTDHYGNVHYLDKHRIVVSVEGEGTLQAVGTANPKPELPFDGEICEAFQGRGQAVIRSGFKEGVIRIKVLADGYPEKTMELFVRGEADDYENNS